MLAKQGKSLESNNQQLKLNNAELQKINKLLREQNLLQAQQDSSQQVLANALKDTIVQRQKDIKTQDSTIDIKVKELSAKKDTAQKLDSANKAEAQNLQLRKNAIAKQLDSLEVIAELEMYDSVIVWKHMADKASKGKEKDNSLLQKNKTYKNAMDLVFQLLNADPKMSFKAVADSINKVTGVPEFSITKINQVDITVSEGVINEIIVNTEAGIFRNKSSSIDLLHFGLRRADLLYLETMRPDDALTIAVPAGLVVKYTPMHSYSDAPYTEFTKTLLPDSANRFYLIKESTSINTYFNIAAFTDIKGVSGEPNGIAQFVADAKFLTRTRNFPNCSIIPFNYISFQGGMSKFDNDFKGTELLKEDSVSRRDLLQRANYTAGIKINLLHVLKSPRPTHLFHSIELNGGYNFIGSRIFDTSFKDDAHTVIDTTFRNITQNQFYLEPSLTLSRHGNFSICMSLPVYFNSIKKSALISNNQLEYWAKPSISLVYYSKRESGSKIFFRYNHFINLKDKTRAFSQIQLGYSVNLTDIWNEDK